MNQQCKVCGEPAAGFHFGAFTCEGCKSFFGRSYNNLNSISDCKNNGECIINKKNRTSCKACRLRKCLLVGMSKSGSRYGRRSNWFKIHCLLQEQQQQAASHRQQKTPPPVTHPALGMLGHPVQQLDPRLHHQLAAAMSHHHALQGRTKEDLLLLGLDECKNSTSPSSSSPKSHNSETSVEVSESRLLTGGGLFLNNNGKCSFDQQSQRPGSNGMFVPLPFSTWASLAPAFQHSAAFFPPAFNGAAPPHSPFLFPPSSYQYPQQQAAPKTLLKNNNNRYTHNNNEPQGDVFSKRFFLDAILRSQQSPNGGNTVREDEEEEEDEVLTEDAGSPKHPSSLLYSPNKRKSPHQDDPVQENPMDLSMKSCQEHQCEDDDRRSLSAGSADDEATDLEDEDMGEIAINDIEDDAAFERDSDDMVSEQLSRSVTSAPMDLTTRA